MEKLLRIKVHPGSRENRLEERSPMAWEAWVRAEAEQGRANAAVLKLLAQNLGIAVQRLHIVKGARTSSKIVAILGN